MLEKIEPKETEVLSKARRRTFTAKERRRIVQEADACTQPGELGALLRREGIYSSYLTSWRREIEQRELAALEPRKRGAKAKMTYQDRKISALEHENAQLKVRIVRTELLVDIQKKVLTILGIPLPDSDEKR